MKKFFILLITLEFLFQFNLVFGQNYYRSNSIGLVYEKIPNYRIDEFDWILEIIKDNYIEKRVLYFNGSETSRKEFFNDGNTLIISEYDSKDLIHLEKKRNGLIIKEENYENNILKNEYFYEYIGRQLNKTTYLENKLVVYEDNFLLTENGEINQIRRNFNDGKLITSGVSSFDHGRSYEWYADNDDFIFYKYSEGKLVKMENWKNGILNRTKIYTFSNLGSIETETDLISGKINTKVFDLSDNILSESTINGNIVEKIIYKYNENLLVQKNIATTGVRNKYFYEYDSENDLKLEKILKDDMLVKEIFYNQGEKTFEKLYKDNSLILIVSYKNGEKVDEEYIQ